MAKREAVTQKIKVQYLYPNELNYILRMKMDLALRRTNLKLFVSITKVLYLPGPQQQ